MVRALLRAGADPNVANAGGETALIFAAGRLRNMSVLNALLSAGARVNQADKAGRTSLMRAAAVGASENIAVLVLAGARVDYVNKAGESALSYAIVWQREEAVKSLLKAGARVNYRDKPGGWTPLHYAVNEKSSRIVALLLMDGADTSVRDRLERTPGALAEERHHWKSQRLVVEAKVRPRVARRRTMRDKR
jgi:ankyrin repeat protein